MTPLAAQLFRHGDTDIRDRLAVCQFFECTSLYPLAREMWSAEIARTKEGDQVDSPFSEFAQLPAPSTVLELNTGRGRQAMVCGQIENVMLVEGFIPGPSGIPVLRWTSGFIIGEPTVLKTSWLVYGDEKPIPGGILKREHREWDIVQAGLSTVETLLCIINQPGLVDARARPSDKRVIREAQRSQLSAPDVWHECRIRPGAHAGSTQGRVVDASVMPLHYVRKYFKPSVQKWIEGYWRGDIALGLHLKWYSPQPPRQSSILPEAA